MKEAEEREGGRERGRGGGADLPERWVGFFRDSEVSGQKRTAAEIMKEREVLLLRSVCVIFFQNDKSHIT